MKQLRDVFAYADVHFVVYTLEENGVHALSAEGDDESYADDEIKRYNGEFLFENRELEMGSLFVTPIILMPKNDYGKIVIDARYLNSVTDLTNYSWPLEPAQMIMTRVNGKVFSVSDLSCAYHQVPVCPETQKLISFINGGKQYTYTCGFYSLCGLPNFFSQLMTIHFDPLIKKKQSPMSTIE